MRHKIDVIILDRSVGGRGDQEATVFPKTSMAAEWMVSVANWERYRSVLFAGVLGDSSRRRHSGLHPGASVFLNHCTFLSCMPVELL